MPADFTRTRVPDLTLHTLVDGQLKTVSTAELFGDKKVVVFGLPGAFTPTCSTQHVPRYEQLYGALAEAGVDDVVCVSVNDAFVMDAWGKDQGVKHVTLVADGNGALTDALGMLVDKSDLGFGKRSWRYSAVIDDGVVTKAFVEPDVPGDPFEVSDADTMLGFLAPNANKPHDILLLTKPGCGHCARAKSALREAGVDFAEVRASGTMLRAVSDTPSTPRVFIDGALVGGADELLTWLAEQ